MEELSLSIIEKGVLQPILVKDEKDHFILIAGERRYEASKLAGLKKIPAIIIAAETDEDLLELAIIENVQRENLNPIEEARAYSKLASTFQLSHEEIAKKVGKSRVVITNLVRLLNLSSSIQERILNGSLTTGHAKVLLSVEDPEEREILAHDCEKNSLSVRELEKAVKSMGKDASAKTLKDTEPNPFIEDVQNQLIHHLGTKVNIQDRSNKGRIMIEYYSLEDLNRLTNQLLGKDDHEK